MLHLLFLLLPIAAATGWYAGLRQQHHERNKEQKETSSVYSDYLVGLNYLINEQPDKAIDVFVKMLEVNDDTVETHVALGSLFRRRGEVDRAIRIHQNLIARPKLSSEQRARALSELGLDYLRAGFLDRAENVFLELVKSDNKDLKGSYNYLLNIYQLQKDWPEAIKIAKKLESEDKMSAKVQIAHYYCELSENAFQNSDLTLARDYLKKALAADPKCVRANMLYAQFAFSEKEYETAIRYLKAVKSQNIEYLSETLKLLSECYFLLHKEEDYLDFLDKTLEKCEQIPVVLELAHHLRKLRGYDAAILFLTEKMKHNSSLASAQYLLQCYIENSKGEAKQQFEILYNFIQKLLENTPNYRCSNCGFAGKSFYWQCPSCRRWSSIRRVDGI